MSEVCGRAGRGATLCLAQALLRLIRRSSALALLAGQVTLVRVHRLPGGTSYFTLTCPERHSRALTCDMQ